MSLQDRAAKAQSVGAKGIVAGIDGSAASLRALEWAARQAEFTGAAQEVVAAWEWPESFGWSAIPSEYNPEQDAQQMLEPLVAALRAAHTQIAISMRLSRAIPRLFSFASRRERELLVVGSRGHGEFVGMLIGSTSQHCVTNAACPVVVFREDSLPQ